MPKKLERALKKEAKRKFPGDKEAQDRYVYGYLKKREINMEKKEDDK